MPGPEQAAVRVLQQLKAVACAQSHRIEDVGREGDLRDHVECGRDTRCRSGEVQAESGRNTAGFGTLPEEVSGDS